ncbi:MAG: hypothetical protein R6U84_08170, partial [Candidatus Cloacimonadales bacterium]
VVGANLVTEDHQLLIASAKGYGKRVRVKEFSAHRRGPNRTKKSLNRSYFELGSEVLVIG